MTQQNPAQELLVDLGKRIAEEEMKTRKTIERRLSYNDPAEDLIREEWRLFHLRTDPLLRQHDYILGLLVQAAACKQPDPIIFANGE